MKVITRKQNGKTRFLMDFYLDGVRRRKVIKGVSSKREAEIFASKWWTDLHRRRALGEAAGPSEAEKAVTLGRALDADEERPGISPWTRRMERGLGRNLRRVLGEETRLHALTGATIETYKAKRTDEGVSAKTVNLELGLLKAMLARLKKNGVLSRVPVEIEKLPAVRPRRRALTREEALALLTACRETPGLYDLAAFMLNTALRRNELFTLAWKAVDFERSAIRIETKKRGTSDTIHVDDVPLNPVCMDILRRRFEESGGRGLVFGIAPEARRSCATRKGEPGTVGGVVCSWDYGFRDRLKAAARRAKIRNPEEVTPHTLRHSAATLLIRSGASLPDVAKILRHRDPAMTARVYLHEAEADMRKALDTLALSAPEAVHTKTGTEG